MIVSTLGGFYCRTTRHPSIFLTMQPRLPPMDRPTQLRIPRRRMGGSSRVALNAATCPPRQTLGSAQPPWRPPCTHPGILRTLFHAAPMIRLSRIIRHMGPASTPMPMGWLGSMRGTNRVALILLSTLVLMDTTVGTLQGGFTMGAPMAITS